MNDSEDDIIPVDPSYIQLLAQSTIRQPDEENISYNKDQNISRMVTPPCQDNSLELESQDELGSNKELLKYQKQVYNKYTGPQSIVTDQYAAHRNEYVIESSLNLYREGGYKPEDNVLFWQNHEGTKSVILELICINSITILFFTLIDSRYCTLAEQQYQFEKEFKIKEFQFSYDESYLAIQIDWDQYLFCYFDNGFENDLFDEVIGQKQLQKMLLTTLKIEGLEKPKDIQFRISGDKIFLLFAEFEEEWPYYASKKTVEELIKDQKVLLSINEDFELKNLKPKQKRIFKIDGPYIIGFDKEDNLYWIQNYENRREYTIKGDKMLLQESKDLTKDKVFFYPNLTNYYLQDQFFFIGSKNLFIYHLDSFNNYDTLECYSPFSYPSQDFIQYKKLKIIEGKSIICYRQDRQHMYLYFYDIDFDNKKIELKTKIYSKYFTHDLMKNSFHMVNRNDIYNYISSPYQNHVYPIIMNRNERIIGINCFNEFLSNGDFQAYTQQAFPYQEFPIDLIFYSKSLNLFVSKGCTVHFLNGQDSQKIENGQIKNLVIFGKEVLRIFDIQSEPNIITCFTFLEDSNIIKQRSEKYLESQFILLSENNDEIAIINKLSMNIIKVNDKHRFDISGKNNDEIFQKIKSEASIRFLHRIIIIDKQMHRFSEDYSKKVASISIYGHDPIFQKHQNYLIELHKKYAYIYDIDHLQLRSKIKFDTNLLDLPDSIEDYSSKKLDRNNLFFRIRGTYHLKRIQVVNDDQIFGVPLTMIHKPNLMSKLYKNILGYYPQNAEGTFDENNLLACTHLNFFVNPLTEYQYFTSQLADREDDIIQNIDKADRSIYDVIPFNILHNIFSLKLLLKLEAKKILYHFVKKLQLNADQGKALPYLMFEDKNKDLLLLKQAIENIDLNILNKLMEFCIKQDHLGLLYADYISPYLYEMKKKGYNLKPLFESSIFFYKVYIKNPNFPHYEPKFKYCIIHSNENKMEDVILRKQLKFEEEENKEDMLAFKIEYYIVNLKDHINNQDVDLRGTILNNLKAQQIIQLFDELSDKDITYLDIELLQMLATVLNDMTSFLYFFGFVVIFFSVLVGIILKDLSEYENVGPVAYFVIAMRESIGDFDTDSYFKNTDYKIIGWIVYVMVMFLGNVIFMNFIIAVVGQSYDNCMQRSVAQSFKVKLHMIKERESMMSETGYKNQEWFPNFIILCKPHSQGINSDDGAMQNEWNGLLKEIEKGVKRQFEVTNVQQRKIISSIERDIKMLETKESSNEIKKQISENNFKMEELHKKIEQKMEHSNKKMEEMKIEMKEMKQEINTRFEELKVLLTQK